MIVTDDHPPAHVHVEGRGTARITFEDAIEIGDNRGLSKADVKRAIAVVTDNREMLLEKWRLVHG